ncbi:MAG: quinolinate synthase [Candidatus Cloacimonadota bacterium]|nr:MAG: quinolinate synthase [Candidatus Cloacimonadota bacterium]PIE77832.1 MAG: quinolinate synthase [Candidatus Delongbacteria bacterium]
MQLEDYKKMGEKELIERINKAKKEKNAVILVHNYQRLNIHQVADFLGDSFTLAQKGSETEADMIIFCGIDFMAETVKILSPEKRVIVPDKNAESTVTFMPNVEELKKLRDENPNAKIITHIDSYASIKAESDVICTSSNAVKIVEHYKDEKIIFCPDKNLGEYCRDLTGADITLWNGHCSLHNEFSEGDIFIAKYEHPNCLLLAHPKSPTEVLERADFIGSTSQIIQFVEDNQDLINEKAGVLIGTEVEVAKMLQKRFPNKPIFPLADHAVSEKMKLTTLAKICYAIENGAHEIEVDKEVSEKALKALDKMVELDKIS